NLTKIKTLVIDEDSAIRTVLRKTLTEWGAEVVEADTGPGGIAELARAREAGQGSQLILVASAMSTMDGFEVAEHLRSNVTEFAHMILMVGSEQITSQLSRARLLGIPWVAK